MTALEEDSGILLEKANHFTDKVLKWLRFKTKYMTGIRGVFNFKLGFVNSNNSFKMCFS